MRLYKAKCSSHLNSTKTGNYREPPVNAGVFSGGFEFFPNSRLFSSDYYRRSAPFIEDLHLTERRQGMCKPGKLQLFVRYLSPVMGLAPAILKQYL
jgi:hypothetical protein